MFARVRDDHHAMHFLRPLRVQQLRWGLSLWLRQNDEDALH